MEEEKRWKFFLQRYHIAKLRAAKLEDLGIPETIHWSQKRISFYHTHLAFSIYHPIPNYEDKIFLKLLKIYIHIYIYKI